MKLNSGRLFLHFFNTAELNLAVRERCVCVIFLHCSLGLVQKSVDQLLPCWVAVVTLMLFSHGPSHSVEQSGDSGAVILALGASD